ncbi:MAG: hypothetical protein M1832_004289 [Thelocarpon impressellum]|nr:MAG: hypothetical protein M1832_004289 [Thelocarpon impressellum]
MTGPVCKIVDKQEHRQVEKARGRQPKNFNNVVKQVEINWAIDANDLGHRLDRMEEFLGKGMRVEVVMASKRKGKGRRATPEEAGAVLAKIRSRLKDLNGVRETKNMEGKILGNATLFYEGRQQRKASAVPSQIEASATASSEMSN